MPKVVIIGAGSLVFSSRLTADILTYNAFANAHFALVDVDNERLSYAKQIVERIFSEGGYTEATVSAHSDRTEALEDADYVIISILVGGYEAIEAEIDIPMKYGVDQCIGDTLTPGGIMRCIRTLPAMQEMAHDIMKICPKAYVLNYTNPMSMLIWGMQEAEPELRLVGLCHSVQGGAGEWSGRLGVPLEEVNYVCAGINHQAFYLSFEHNGKDMLPAIRELALKPEIWKGDSTRMEYLKHFGYPVTESSGHGSEYNPWFRKNAETIAKYCDNSSNDWNGAHGFIKKLYNRPDWREQMKKMASWEKPISLARSHEYGSMILNAIETGEPTVIYGNVKNHGVIDNLPHDCVVEVPCLVDKNGIQPTNVGKLPSQLAAINTKQVEVQRLAVEAVQKQDPEIVFYAMAHDPLTSMSCTLDEIRSMTRELMEAHKAWIPVMRGKLPAEKPLVYKKNADWVEKHVDPAEANQI
ncbi:MAG: alpha-galactosidase [Spirochaetota bacterium]